jgi:hypothetical protein
MLYTSPFDILSLPSAELQQLDKKMLQLKKKQLLAELQLQSSDVITLSGKEFTKNDIVLLFEQLEQDDALAMHAAIAADPALLQFLQTGKINPGQKFNYNPLYQEPDFIAFVSPFYKETFNRHILKALASNDYARIEGVFGNPVLLTGEDYDQCFGKLHGYLEEKLHGLLQLKERLAANRRTDLSSLHDYYIYDWVKTLNNLPDAFAGFREDYAIELYNLAVDLWNGKRRDEARALLYGIESIDATPHVKKLIADLLQQTSRLQEPASGGSGGSNMVWIVISLLIMLIRVGVTCNRSSSSNNYNYSDNSSYLKTYLEEQKKRKEADAFKVGYSAFKPVNKRDKAFMAMLKTLMVSIMPNSNDQRPPMELANGSDPYAELFDKPLFKAAGKTPASASNRLSAVEIQNHTSNESIVFLYSQQLVKSVYLKPNSNYTVDLPKGTYWAFCYGGNGFNTGLPLNLADITAQDVKNSFATMGRFRKTIFPLMPYLSPEKNLHFITGNPNTSITTTATISIDLLDSDHFDMQSGKGVTALKKVLNDPDATGPSRPKIVPDPNPDRLP